MRRFIYRTRYLRTKELAVQIQCVARRKVALAKIQSLKEEKAAIIIQKNWRRYTARKQFLMKQTFILRLQTGIFIPYFSFFLSLSLLIYL